MAINASNLDLINRETMRNSVNVYAGFAGLGPAETSALGQIADKARGGRILDLGVGGGRTVEPLLALSNNYIGIDYVAEMVAACQAKYPGVRFEHADARSMQQFETASFDLIVFAWAGICMVDHAGRLAILKEIRRLLAPGGHFVFSTYNLNNLGHLRFELPPLSLSINPLKTARGLVAFSRSLALRTYNRLKLRGKEVHTAEYSIINDRCHDYRTMLYYISPKAQNEQLRAEGFAGNILAYDSNGVQACERCTDNALTFVVSG